MSIFPGAIPPAGTAVTTDTLAAAGHTALHNTSYDEIRALATKLGTGSSTPTASTVLRGTGVGTSSYGQVVLTTDVTGVLPLTNGGTGQTNLNGLTLPNPNITCTVTGGATYTSPVLTTPTLTTPTIADFTNAQHDHSDPDDGGQIVSGAIPADAVNDSQMIYGKVRSRQGGSATAWNTNGATTYDVSATNTFIQCGAQGLSTVGVDVTITFPTAFTNKPIVILTVMTSNVANVYATANTITTTGFKMRALDGDGSGEVCGWIAIGE